MELAKGGIPFLRASQKEEEISYIVIFTLRIYKGILWEFFSGLNVSQNFYNEANQSRKVAPGAFQGFQKQTQGTLGCMDMIHVRT